jgi:hypothetical protein
MLQLTSTCFALRALAGETPAVPGKILRICGASPGSDQPHSKPCSVAITPETRQNTCARQQPTLSLPSEFSSQF